MSGVVKGVKKVFKAVGKVVKKIAKPLAIAAAAYFTGGLALSAFPATQSFAAALPGFGISSTGAATGVFSKAASSIGLAGGLKAGAGVSATAATAVGSAAATAGTAGAAAAKAGAAVGAAGAGTAAAAATGMSLTEKLILAQMGSKALGAFLAPTIDEEYEARAKWRGAYYGTYAGGGTDPGLATSQPSPHRAFMKPEAPASPAPATAPQGGDQQPTSMAASNRSLMTVDQGAANSSAGPPTVDAAMNRPVEQMEIGPRKLMQEDVRYV